MAGATIEFDYRDALNRLLAIETTLTDPTEMLRDMGEELRDIHRDRFRAQTSPSGVPWVPLKPWYQESKPRNQNRILTLFGLLKNTLRYQISGSDLLFGTDRPYGAIHNFGGIIKPKTAKALNVGGRPVKQVTIPQREWLGVSEPEGERLLEIARRHLQGN